MIKTTVTIFAGIFLFSALISGLLGTSIEDVEAFAQLQVGGGIGDGSLVNDDYIDSLLGTIALPSTTPSKFSMSDLRVADSFGNAIHDVQSGKMVWLEANIRNNQDTIQQFTYVLKIYDSNDILVDTQWISSTAYPTQEFRPAVSWLPTIEGTYTAIVSVLNDLESAVELAPEIKLVVVVSTSTTEPGAGVQDTSKRNTVGDTGLGTITAVNADSILVSTDLNDSQIGLGRGITSSSDIVVTSSYSPINTSVLSDAPPSKLSMPYLKITDRFENNVYDVQRGKLVWIEANITNYNDVIQQFTYVLKIYDPNNILVDTQWISGTIHPIQELRPAVSWLPTMEGEYTAIAFVLNDLKSAVELAPEIKLVVTVEGDGTTEPEVVVQDTSSSKKVVNEKVVSKAGIGTITAVSVDSTLASTDLNDSQIVSGRGIISSSSDIVITSPHPSINTPVLSAAPSKLSMANLRVTDSFENSIHDVQSGKIVQIGASVINKQDRKQEITYIVQIYDTNDIVVSVQWISAVLYPKQKFSPSVSWIPETPGTYTASAFAWDTLTNAMVLAPEIKLVVTVSGFSTAKTESVVHSR